MSTAAGVDGHRHREMADLTARTRPIGPAEMAWIALLPCMLAGVAAIVLLGPPVGHLLFTPGADQLWPRDWWEATGRPEPVKQGRYVVAVVAPALLFATILLGPRHTTLRPLTVRALVLTSNAIVLALIAAALLSQRLLLSPEFPVPPIFSLRMVLVACAIACALALVWTLASRRQALLARWRGLRRDTRLLRWGMLAAAAGFSAVWLLQAPTTDALQQGETGLRGTWTLNDAIAVLDGRTPLVDYHPIYGKLVPYLAAVALWAFGADLLVYTTFMAVLAGFALLAVYAVFRQVTRSSLLAVGLFVPFVAASDIEASVEGSPLTVPAIWPMRYGGAYLLAWILVRHLAGRRPRRQWFIFFVAGLVVLNNVEFGMGAAVATTAALVCARPPRSARHLLRLLVNAAAGALAAFAVVALLTLVRAGALPDLGLLVEWPRIFVRLGWFSMPLPTWELHLLLYATFVASVAVAAVRMTRRDADTLLTAMLVWSGVFGLLAGGYYIGRPDAGHLTALMSAWSFAISMLTVVTLRGLAGGRWRPTVPRLLVLFGFALTICSLGALPSPQAQVSRLREPGSAQVYLPRAEQFVAQHVRPRETVAILLPMSYRISYEMGLRNVAPYGFMNAIVTRSQFRTLINVLRSEHVAAVFTPAVGSRLANEGDAAPQQLDELVRAGYRPVAITEGFIAFRRD